MKLKSFTLVELLVVLVIIGVLVAMILPNALKAINQANTKECASNIRTIDTATQMYYTENRAWPADTSDLSQYFADGIAPICPFGIDYSLAEDTSTGGKKAKKDDHFSTWPTAHSGAPIEEEEGTSTE